jgi:L-rhamnose mutarotase
LLGNKVNRSKRSAPRFIDPIGTSFEKNAQMLKAIVEERVEPLVEAVEKGEVPSVAFVEAIRDEIVHNKVDREQQAVKTIKDVGVVSALAVESLSASQVVEEVLAIAKMPDSLTRRCLKEQFKNKFGDVSRTAACLACNQNKDCEAANMFLKYTAVNHPLATEFTKKAAVSVKKLENDLAADKISEQVSQQQLQKYAQQEQQEFSLIDATNNAVRAHPSNVYLRAMESQRCTLAMFPLDAKQGFIDREKYILRCLDECQDESCASTLATEYVEQSLHFVELLDKNLNTFIENEYPAQIAVLYQLQQKLAGNRQRQLSVTTTDEMKALQSQYAVLMTKTNETIAKLTAQTVLYDQNRLDMLRSLFAGQADLLNTCGNQLWNESHKLNVAKWTECSKHATNQCPTDCQAMSNIDIKTKTRYDKLIQDTLEKIEQLTEQIDIEARGSNIQQLNKFIAQRAKWIEEREAQRVALQFLVSKIEDQHPKLSGICDKMPEESKQLCTENYEMCLKTKVTVSHEECYGLKLMVNVLTNKDDAQLLENFKLAVERAKSVEQPVPPTKQSVALYLTAWQEATRIRDEYLQNRPVGDATVQAAVNVLTQDFNKFNGDGSPRKMAESVVSLIDSWPANKMVSTQLWQKETRNSSPAPVLDVKITKEEDMKVLESFRSAIELQKTSLMESIQRDHALSTSIQADIEALVENKDHQKETAARIQRVALDLAKYLKLHTNMYDQLTLMKKSLGNYNVKAKEFNDAQQFQCSQIKPSNTSLKQLCEEKKQLTWWACPEPFDFKFYNNKRPMPKIAETMIKVWLTIRTMKATFDIRTLEQDDANIESFVSLWKMNKNKDMTASKMLKDVVYVLNVAGKISLDNLYKKLEYFGAQIQDKEQKEQAVQLDDDITFRISNLERAKLLFYSRLDFIHGALFSFLNLPHPYVKVENPCEKTLQSSTQFQADKLFEDREDLKTKIALEWKNAVSALEDLQKTHPDMPYFTEWLTFMADNRRLFNFLR